MLYRPNFCANCGEKVERTDWGVFTSRRFCAVCESEFKGQDLIPRAIVAMGLIIGLFGIGAYMRSGPTAAPPVAFRQTPNQPPPRGPFPQPANNVPTAQTAEPSSQTAAARPVQLTTPYQQVPSVPRYEAADEVYICGAETKKGTPCSRRVKGNVRCFQHKGMPAMLPAEKLKVG